MPDVVKPYVPDVPYPHRLKKKTDDSEFRKFLSMFKQLNINIPFADVIAQIPKYGKFLKDILTRRRRIDERETVFLNEECSAIMLNKLPQKRADPGSFTVPCCIRNHPAERALCDLGASINLMPYSLCQKLGLGEVKPTAMTIQMADRSVAYPRGIVENILIKVDNLYFPVDFVIMDMEEDRKVPIILGRSFLATSHALIDMAKGRLTLRVGEEEANFSLDEAMKFPGDEDACLRMDIVDDLVAEIFHEEYPILPLESCMVHSDSSA
jgi:hypothetical protein